MFIFHQKKVLYGSNKYYFMYFYYVYLSFSSQWERLQHDEGEAGQLKGNLQLTRYTQRFVR